MPSQTFFNLPQEKQDRIMRAAREEFFTHSMDDASINRLIKAAGIPRGSFYQYFDDKEDVYCYLGEQISRGLFAEAYQQLAESDYDPFKLARQVLPRWLKEVFYGENRAFFYRQIDLLYQQQMPRVQHVQQPLSGLSQEELEKMAAKVNLQDQEDLKFLLHSFLLVLVSCISSGAADYRAGKEVDLDKLNRQLNRRLDYLENGFRQTKRK